MRRQVAKLLERAIARLPEAFRPVFVLRDVEELSVEETAEALQIPKETVKTRLLRARRRLQAELDPELRGALQLRSHRPADPTVCEIVADQGSELW
jgi:RNA polymerase sigma-70 factor (ECF subfamily)